MAHLLVIDLPGGEDADLLHAARRRGDTVTFLTSHLAVYLARPDVAAALPPRDRCIEVPGFALPDVLAAVHAVHARSPVKAVLCLVDIRLVEAAEIAQALGLRHIAPDAARRIRDKHAVRARLQARGLPQPPHRLACTNAEVAAAVDALGLPVLIKPADGYGSQNIVVLREHADLDPWLSPVHDLLPSGADYGLGVMANDRLVVERLMAGTVAGCDVFVADGRATVLGVHEKRFFPSPSFAILGGTFVPAAAADAAHEMLAAYASEVLAALDFRDGAAHVEIMCTPDGPRLVEANGRLVGARIPRLVGHALGRSVHEDLIDLHLGRWTPRTAAAGAGADATAPAGVAVTRWIAAPCAGRLRRLEAPAQRPPAVRETALLARPGDAVRPPLENADRLGYVMAVHADRAAAERTADEWVAAVHVDVDT